MTGGSGARVMFDVPAKMRDGVTLYADVYLPSDGPPPGASGTPARGTRPSVLRQAQDGALRRAQGGASGTGAASSAGLASSARRGRGVPGVSENGRCPVVLMRTPYDKSQAFGRAAGSGALGLEAVKRGFAVVIQDTRGRFKSEGEFTPFVHEAEDGYDTIEWVAKQPWSNGKTGMFGGSYVGATQWLAATSQPPHLTAIAPLITASDYHEGWTYQGGAFELGFNLSWALGALTMRNGENLARRLGLSPERLEEMLDATDAMAGAFRALPLSSQPFLERDEAAYYFDWLSHSADDRFWKGLRIEGHHQKIGIPSLNVGGWYDIFLMGTIRNYGLMRSAGGSDDARRGARLVIGPWSHTALAANAAGTIDYGQRAGAAGIDLDDATLRFYERWLMGAQNGVDREPPVRIFVMGENRWRDEKEWPLARAKRTRYYLHSAGKANSRRGDGALSTSAPHDERPDMFLYDPVHPVPTRGGGLCCAPWAGALPAGPMDQRAKEDRPDILVYSTPALERDVEVTGPVRATIWASSSAVDTDFTAMLVDVAPSGEAINLCDGILRARWRSSRAKPSLLVPGRAEKFEIDLVATSNLFKKGHRVRLEVASSNFPRFDRNLNTGKGPDSAEVVVATNTVFHDTQRASYVEMDVLPR